MHSIITSTAKPKTLYQLRIVVPGVLTLRIIVPGVLTLRIVVPGVLTLRIVVPGVLTLRIAFLAAKLRIALAMVAGITILDTC